MRGRTAIVATARDDLPVGDAYVIIDGHARTPCRCPASRSADRRGSDARRIGSCRGLDVDMQQVAGRRPVVRLRRHGGRRRLIQSEPPQPDAPRGPGHPARPGQSPSPAGRAAAAAIGSATRPSRPSDALPDPAGKTAPRARPRHRAESATPTWQIVRTLTPKPSAASAYVQSSNGTRVTTVDATRAYSSHYDEAFSGAPSELKKRGSPFFPERSG